MRTTLDIEDEVLQAVKERAQHEGITTGKLASQMLREALTKGKKSVSHKVTYRNGVPVFPATGEIVTLAHIRKLMDEAGI